MKQLHSLQLRILKKLLFAQELRYTDLKPDPKMENNLLDFHLNRLIKEGYIQKGKRHYSLTNQGKEYANRMDTKQILITNQSKVSVWICCQKTQETSQKYLIYTRLKQPFYGCQGFITGKVKFGEKVINAANRELKEEAGLEGNPQIITIKHYLVFDRKSKKLVEDKFMFLCLVKDPEGKLKARTKEGKLKWVDKKDLKSYVTNHFESFSSFREQLKQIKNFKGEVTFLEINYLSSKF